MNGNVGIGGNNPSHALLETIGNSATEMLRINDSGANDATPFVVSSSGNVGVGTNSPLALLSVGVGNPAVVGANDAFIKNNLEVGGTIYANFLAAIASRRQNCDNNQWWGDGRAYCGCS